MTKLFHPCSFPLFFFLPGGQILQSPRELLLSPPPTLLLEREINFSVSSSPRSSSINILRNSHLDWSLLFSLNSGSFSMYNKKKAFDVASSRLRNTAIGHLRVARSIESYLLSWSRMSQNFSNSNENSRTYFLIQINYFYLQNKTHF